MSTRSVLIQPAQISWRQGVPYAEHFDDVYFSTENGVEEARHVFIEGNALPARWRVLAPSSSFIIAETGFGTGLNFLLTWALWKKYAPAGCRLYYVSCELHPLTPQDLARCVALWPAYQVEALALMKQYPKALTPGFHRLTFGDVQLHLMLGDATDCYQSLLLSGDGYFEPLIRTWCVDAWYLDGFSPQKNHLMWHKDLLTAISLLSNAQTTAATFSVAKMVKTGLKDVGFWLEKRPGFGAKRECLHARFTQAPAYLRRDRQTPWQCPSFLSKLDGVRPHHTLQKKPQAIIIGGGLAGCYVAHLLAQQHWQVTIMDEHAQPAQGASGNQQAILFPKLSAFKAPMTDFMLHCYLQAISVYQTWLAGGVEGELNGMLQLAWNEKECRIQQSLEPWLLHYSSLGRLVQANEASKIAGIPLSVGGLWLPESGWINMVSLCQHLLQTPGIRWLQQPVTRFDYNDDVWQIGDQCADILIIANGEKAKQFEQTSYLPLKSMYGQMTYIPTTAQSSALQIPLCAAGHILPARQGWHALGATYHQQSSCSPAHDNLSNIDKLASLSNERLWAPQAVSDWRGIRAATPDYMPLVGAVADQHQFKKVYAKLAANRKQWIPALAPCYPGLFICCGFGSRGLTTIPWCAQYLVSSISEPTIYPKWVVKALSPMRFLQKF